MENSISVVEGRTLHEISLQRKLWADLTAASLDFCEDLLQWSSCGNVAVTDTDLDRVVDRVLYMYVSEPLAYWCVRARCLPYNSRNFGAVVTSLPPYLLDVDALQLSRELRLIGGGSPIVEYEGTFSTTHFVALLPSTGFERLCQWCLAREDGLGTEYDVFAIGRPLDRPREMFFNYEIISAGECLFWRGPSDI